MPPAHAPRAAHRPPPAAVVAVAGRYRSGKSFLLNQLSGSVGAFGVGDTVESHTRGLWLLHTGLVATAPEGYEVDVVFLDSEGLGATDRVRPRAWRVGPRQGHARVRRPRRLTFSPSRASLPPRARPCRTRPLTRPFFRSR